MTKVKNFFTLIAVLGLLGLGVVVVEGSGATIFQIGGQHEDEVEFIVRWHLSSPTNVVWIAEAVVTQVRQSDFNAVSGTQTYTYPYTPGHHYFLHVDMANDHTAEPGYWYECEIQKNGHSWVDQPRAGPRRNTRPGSVLCEATAT